MKKLFLFLLVFLSIGIESIAQNYYISVPSGGSWTADATWDLDGDGLNVATDGVPGANDIAVIIGDGAGGGNVNITSNVSVGDIYIQFDNTSVLSKTSAPFVPNTLTINGQLVGFDYYGTFNYATPTTTVIENDVRLNLVFTGDNIAGGTSINPAIYFWDHSATLKNLTFNPTSSTTNIQIEDLSINASNVTISNGTLTINNGFSLAQSGNSTLTIASGSNFVVNGAINGDGTNSTRFGTITNNGNITTGTSAYINSESISMGANATFTINFNGAGQTEGWWYQSVAPTTPPTLDVTSTITYNANAGQTVGSENYGNLILSGNGTKTLQSTGTFNVLGDFTISSASTSFVSSSNPNPIEISGDLINDGTWAPTQLVDFVSTTSNQNITGNNMVSFGGGARVSNSFGTVSLFNQDMDVNGTLDIDPSANFNPNGQQINLSGNLINDGSLTASGTFVFDGTTTVSGSGTSAFENVTVSGTLSAPSMSAAIAGNFTNNGTFDNLNGTVDFNGINPQSITGSSTTNFYNLDITNSSATVSNNGTVNLNTAMTLASNSTFDADGSSSGVFTIVSTSGSNTARINAIPSSASVTGNVVAQRYFDGGGDVWRNFGTPVNGASVSQITGAGFTITGNDLAYYDETVTGGVDNGWVLQSTFGSPISNSRGYSMWTRTEEMPVTINFTGTLNQQAQSMPLTYTNSGSPTDDGWNLVNNPFPSTVDWDLMTRNGSVSGTVAVWNTSTAGYDYWNGSTGNLTNGLIASGQAFWVQTNGAGPTLSIPESAKATSSASFLKVGEESAENVLIVALAKSDTVDRTYIQFREDATDGFDPTSDGRKISNGTFGIFNLFSLSTDSNELAINSLPGLVDCQKTIDLGLYQMFWDESKNESYRGFVPGEYSLSFSGFDTFTKSLNFDLVDYYQGNEVITPITSDFVYTFLVDTTQVNSWGDFRFEIRVTEKPIESSVSYNTTSLCDEGTSVNFTNTQTGVEYILQKDGENIVSKISDGADLSLFIPSIYMVEGQNEFDVLLKNGDCSSVLLNGEITFNKSSILEVSSVENGKNCGSGRVLVSTSGATGNAYYNWYESIDATTPIEGQNGNEFLTPELETTKYYYVSIVNETGCESSGRVKVIAEIVNLVQPDISVEGDVLSTQALADGYQWYKDGEVLPDETESTLTVRESGSYSVEIISNGCTSLSENVTMEILGLDELNEMGVSIYPNPVSSVLNINSDQLDIEAIRIFDLKGDMVVEFDDYVPNQIDLTGVKKGIYIVNIATKDQIINYRVKKK